MEVIVLLILNSKRGIKSDIVKKSVMSGLYVKKSVLLFSQIKLYDYVSGITNYCDYQVGVKNRL